MSCRSSSNYPSGSCWWEILQLTRDNYMFSGCLVVLGSDFMPEVGCLFSLLHSETNFMAQELMALCSWLVNVVLVTYKSILYKWFEFWYFTSLTIYSSCHFVSHFSFFFSFHFFFLFPTFLDRFTPCPLASSPFEHGNISQYTWLVI